MTYNYDSSDGGVGCSHISNLAQRDLAVLWHPCTQMQDHEWLPMIPIRRGYGVWLEDYAGQRYLDAISSWWVNLFGHANPRITKALIEQAETLEHVILAGFTHAPAVELAEQLLKLAPAGLSRVFYADNGSAGVEVALKMSYHYWRNLGYHNKTRFVTLSNSYHGETIGALAVGDVPLYKATYQPLLMTAITAPSPDCYLREPGEDWQNHSLGCLADLETILATQGDSISAVIVEPLVQCAGGMRMYHPIYLTNLRTLCSQYQVHLIADEIAVGFGRTGTMFACEQAAICPDFLCLGKGLTGGYLPLCAVLTTDVIYQAFYADYTTLKAFLHSHSYTGNPLACRAALASLSIFAQDQVIAANRILADYMRLAASPLACHPHVSEVRQTGMILAIELVKDKSRHTPYPWQERRGLRVYQYALTQGVLLRPLGNVIYFMPPYVITQEQITQLVRVAKVGIDLATAD